MSPSEPPFASWVERKIQEAADRGEFDDIEGQGEPLEMLEEPYESGWWVKRWIKREGLGEAVREVLRRRSAD